jgi:hypothetical protein
VNKHIPGTLRNGPPKLRSLKKKRLGHFKLIWITRSEPVTFASDNVTLVSFGARSLSVRKVSGYRTDAEWQPHLAPPPASQRRRHAGSNPIN